ncbi:hypothetical protein KS4_36170 [Poriferisphaera corsica]|uniref:DUF1501 domain-containing protein n=1 Tax=Poriferisphaera corsica TaxID=2528020 RepID=A0A517YZ97_9BACT|nr:DUF1501 domain-containing protein [Poriferisphaera corsica]QDU35534.1 hypothetical protein KS4_36170 [Poriferisphaera corsica]
MSTTRRQFIKSSAILTAAAAGSISPWSTIKAFSQSTPLAQAHGCKKTPTLITLYLRGGSDPINTIIPYADSLYPKLRPTIAVPTHNKNNKPQIIPISNHFGFHPAAAPLAELYKQNLLAPILCTGSTHPTRSHFDAQDFMERAAPGIKTITEGWLNRFLQLSQSSNDHPLRALCMQPILPRSLRGQYPVVAVPDYAAASAITQFQSLYTCKEGASAANLNAAKPITAEQNRQRIIQTGQQAIQRVHLLDTLIKNYKPQTTYPNSNLGSQLRDLAAVIKTDQNLQIAAIDYNGWDHHTYQGAATGNFSRMLQNVSNSLLAFSKDLGPHINNTVILVMTEFGRTVKENGNNGTDHGHGGYMLALGGPIAGGQILGKWTGLDQRALYQSRDLPVHTDFRDVFSAVLKGLFQFDTDKHDFFPKYNANPQLLKLFTA